MQMLLARLSAFWVLALAAPRDDRQAVVEN